MIKNKRQPQQYNKSTKQHYKCGDSFDKQQICRDVTVVLKSDKLSTRAKNPVLVQAVWDWTAFEGKFKNCPHWSIEALKYKNELEINKYCTHEHVVPISEVIALLLTISCPTEELVTDIFNQFCIGAVITCIENQRLNEQFKSKMPNGWIGKNTFARYDDLATPIKIAGR